MLVPSPGKNRSRKTGSSMKKIKKIKATMVGSSYPMEWILSFFNVLVWCHKNNFQLDFSFTKGSNIYKCRDKAIIMNQEEKRYAKPFNGEDYDYILWIDSDQIFSAEVLEKLIAADKDIITPLIVTEDGSFSASYVINNQEHAEGVRRLNEGDTRGKTEPMEVGNIGFGFTLIKKGVYEKIQYPWHGPIITENSYYSEDRSFFQRAKDAGFKLWLEPTVKAWHIKSIPL